MENDILKEIRDILKSKFVDELGFITSKQYTVSIENRMLIGRNENKIGKSVDGYTKLYFTIKNDS